MESTVLNNLKNKMINILPYEEEVDAGFFGVKFFRRNNVDLIHTCVQKPCIFFVVNGEKHINIYSKDFLIEKAVIILHILITQYLPILVIFQKIIRTFPYIYQLIIK